MSGHQALRDLDTTWDAGVDVAAHVPWVFNAVEAVDESAEGESGVADEVVGGVGDEVRGIGEAVGGVDEGEGFCGTGEVVR